MSNRILLSALPKIPVCSIRQLLTASASEHSKVNAELGNRRVVKLPNKREVMVVLHPVSGEVFAMDRFCYHHGYPLETGDMEDIGVIELMENNSGDNKKTASEQEEENKKKRTKEELERAARFSSARERKKAGPLKFKKEEEIKAEAAFAKKKSEEEEIGRAKAEESSSSSSATSSSSSKFQVHPGKLEVDYAEDECNAMHEDETYEFPIVTCTLHNRIFDLRTGDMIVRSVVKRNLWKAKKGKASLLLNAEGEEEEESGKQKQEEAEEEKEEDLQKCLLSESTGVHQRIHPVVIESQKQGKEEEEEEEDGMIFFYDTFGYSNPMRRPGSKINMKDRSHLMFLPKKRIVSDKENAAARQPTPITSSESPSPAAAETSSK